MCMHMRVLARACVCARAQAEGREGEKKKGGNCTYREDDESSS